MTNQKIIINKSSKTNKIQKYKIHKSIGWQNTIQIIIKEYNQNIYKIEHCSFIKYSNKILIINHNLISLSNPKIHKLSNMI